jgi:hypothetical protein
LSPTDIVWGTLEALHLHFRALANFVLGLNGLMMLGGLATRHWSRGALTVYFLVWLFLLAWTWSLDRRLGRVLPAMWAGLNCARPARAVISVSGLKSLSWILFNVLQLGRGSKGFPGFPDGSRGELVTCSLVALIWVLELWLRSFTRTIHVPDLTWKPQTKLWSEGAATTCATRLIREFREIVREPLPDPTDPRFKEWDMRERFPWGWALVQEQLHERLARK